MDDFDLVGELRLSESWVGAEENRLVHDFVGTCHLADDAEGLRTVFPQLHEHGLAKEVAAKEHAVADFFLVEVPGEVGVAEGCGGFDTEHEAKPRGVGLAASGVPSEACTKSQELGAMS